MAFDQPTRNRLARFVGEARSLLTEEFTRQLQHEYGLDPARGEVAELAKLTQLDDARRETARILRETLAHYLAGQAAPTAKARQEALDRIVREQAFTVLNRLCALRMAEARGIVIESIAKGYQSRGFQLYARLAGTALGETGEAYRAYLFSLFDEFAVDLAVLFDRFSPQGRLFPRASTLLQLLASLNHADLESLWAEDETIGWIYQYFNSKEERKAMRDASQAPRNSRELAVRNQFFTPRYVVEFLTDNTLGRIWYEMCKGKTRLKEQCRYLVRRPVEIFLDDPDQYLPDECRPWVRRVRSGDFTELPDDPTELELASISFAFNGYTVAEELGQWGNLMTWAREQVQNYKNGGALPASSLDLWLILFMLQREWRIITGSGPAGDDFLALWRQIYSAWKRAVQDSGEEQTQELLLQRPVYIAHRTPKDPITILMLDPACGSMHFGLYAFDLFATIYLEAWEQGWTPATDFPYRDKPTIDHATVQLAAPGDVLSAYSSDRIPFDDAYVMIADQIDAGDGVLADIPYIVASTTTFRVPVRYRTKLSAFDYQHALQTGVFDAAKGEQLVRSSGAFTYTEIPSRHSPEAYTTFQRLVPRLIIEHNIHGIDIDPRAVQIAGLSLWLRAQKSWQAQGLKPHERPTIRKSNIVCAEPMPGDQALLEEFLQGLRDDRLEALIRRVLNVPGNQRVRATPTMADALCQLARTVWEGMKLAGEAGSLLKIEEALTDAIAKGRSEWEEKMPLFRVETFRMTEERPKVNYMKVIPGEGVDFWERAEGLVLAALEEYVWQADDNSYQRRLFAEDAARGFSFIDLCHKRYDVVLMNPPFGEFSTQSKIQAMASYPRTKNDIYAAFIERSVKILQYRAMLGTITSRSGFFLSSFQKWRKEVLLREAHPTIFVDLGYGVLDDAMVEVAAYCLEVAA